MKLIKINEVPERPAPYNSSIRMRVMAAEGAIDGIAHISRAAFPPGEKTGMRQHTDRTEVFTCDAGLGEIRINDVGYVFSPGTTVVVEPGDVHEIINVGTAELIVSSFGTASA